MGEAFGSYLPQGLPLMLKGLVSTFWLRRMLVYVAVWRSLEGASRTCLRETPRVRSSQRVKRVMLALTAGSFG